MPDSVANKGSHLLHCHPRKDEVRSSRMGKNPLSVNLGANGFNGFLETPQREVSINPPVLGLAVILLQESGDAAQKLRLPVD
jgi:hypothetical protein